MDTNLELSCATVRERLSARADGEAPSDADPALSTHLAGCGECARFERLLPELPSLLAPLAELGPPIGIAERLGAAARARRRAGRLGWVVRAAACMVGFLSVFALAEYRTRRAARSLDHSLVLFERAGRALSPRPALGHAERELSFHFPLPEIER